MSSWLKLYRKLAETDLWLAEPFTKGQAWVDLLILARFQDGFTRIRGIKIEVKRGQVSWSEVELAKRWQWSRGKVRRFLGEMEIEQQIEQQKNNITTLISIVNFERYQGNGTADDTANRTADGTANGTAEPPQPTIGADHRTPKNGKNGKNDNIPSEYFTLSQNFLNHQKKQHGNMVKITDAKIRGGAEAIEKLIRKDGFNLENDIKPALHWAVEDEFWSTNILSLAGLRKKGANGEMKFQNLYASYKRKKPKTKKVDLVY